MLSHTFVAYDWRMQCPPSSDAALRSAPDSLRSCRPAPVVSVFGDVEIVDVSAWPEVVARVEVEVVDGDWRDVLTVELGADMRWAYPVERVSVLEAPLGLAREVEQQVSTTLRSELAERVWRAVERRAREARESAAEDRALADEETW